MPGLRTTIAVLLGLLILAAIVADRLYWAGVAQWREDQATNLWLGLTQSLTTIPVGLTSSVGLPNPGGMILLGMLMSRLPSLWTVSALLGCLQAAVVLITCWVGSGGKKSIFLLLCAPLLTSVVLRATSVEFWNQSATTLANLLFLLWTVVYVRRPALGKIPALVGLIMLAPAFYLAGLVNAIVMIGIGAALIVLNPPGGWRQGWWKAMVPSIGILAVLAWLVWGPYFRAVGLGQILATASGAPLATRIGEAAQAVVRFPTWGTAQSCDWSSLAFFQSDRSVLSPAATRLLELALRLQLLQATIGLATLLFAIGRGQGPLTVEQGPRARSSMIRSYLMIVCVGFVIASYALSPLLGGPNWASGDRRDQVTQMTPLLLIFWFLAPHVLYIPPPARSPTRVLTTIVAILFSALSASAGLLVVRSHLEFRGDVLTEADVPLLQKMELVDHVARDWRSISDSRVIPVDYRLGGGRWDWIPEFGEYLNEWYPAPYTIGRAFDYQLLKEYGLANAQEGIQARSFGGGRYLVTYSFEAEPTPVAGVATHVYFGRLRLTVVEPPVVP